MPREDGQATVELLGVLPALVAAGFVIWQLVLVGHTAWMSAHAASAAARADLVGENAAAAARSVLPDALERGVEVQAKGGGEARVKVPLPVVRGDWHSPVKITARASLESTP